MRLFFFVISGMMLLPCLGLAQENNVTLDTSALQEVLSTLKQSIDKLGLDNDQLVAQDKAIKEQVLQLQMQLGHLEASGDVLNKTVARLQDNNPRRSQQISRLEEENSDLDDRIQKAEGDIKLIQQSLDTGYQEDQKLLSPESLAAARLQKEKLKLMKMIYDSQQRQESMHESILEFQKNTPLPALSALAYQQLLKGQIKDLEAQNIAYQPETKGGLQYAPLTAANQWDDAQLHQLELELKVLEKNYLQLKDLMEKMSQKAKAAQMTVSQHIEGEKLQSSMDDLNHQGMGLKADLDGLRAQMIELDKRKSRLEMMIQ